MNNLPGSLYVLQASRIEPGTGRMREVVIYDMSPPDGRRMIYADSGYMAFEDGGNDLVLKLYDGRAHEYKTAEPATVHVTHFAENTINVRDIQNAFQQSFGSVGKGDREMTTCEMMDRVASSEKEKARAAERRRHLAENDLRALLNLFAVPQTNEAPVVQAVPSCGIWRRFERWVGRLLLPRPAAAQAVVTDSAPRAAGGLAAALSTISDVSVARDEEAFATRDVNQYTVEIHKKFTLSIACLSFVLIGVALALRFPRGGIGLVIGASLVIFALFYVSLTAGEQLADRGVVSAAVAMWFPNLVVLIAGVLGLLRVNKEFGSTRGGDVRDLFELLTGWFRIRRKAG